MQFAVCYRSSTRGATISLHKAGCQDIERREKRENGAHPEVIEADSLDTAIQSVLDGELREMGFTEEAIEIYPCASEKNRK